MTDSADMEFELGQGATVHVAASIPSKADPQARVSVRLTLLPLQRARFVTTEIKVKTDSTKEYTALPFSRVHVVYTGASPDGTKATMVYADARDTMDGGPIGAVGIERITNFDFWVTIPVQNPPNFLVILPAIELGDRTITLDPVRFTISTRARLVGFAC
jgi:hypothetical protein